MSPKFLKTDSGFRYFGFLFILWFILGGIFLLLEKERSIYLLINKNNNEFGDLLFPYLSGLGTFAAVVICFILLFLFNPKLRSLSFFFTFLICQLIPFLLIQILKNIINAPRPLKYFENADWIHRITGQPENYSLSFPSGHSEGVFALVCFLALLLPKKWSGLGVLLFFLGLSTAYSRIYLSQHFFADVYVGSLIGAFSVYFLFAYLQKTRFQIKRD